MNIIIDDILTNYLEINPTAKKDCLILHGWGQNAKLWLPLVALLKPDYRFILLDLPAHGNTQFLPHHADIPQYSEFIVNFINKLQLKTPVLIGHSFGGQIAAYLAIYYPKLISQLILISPAITRQKTSKEKIKVTLYSKFNFLKKLLPSPILQFIIKQISSTDYYHASTGHKEILKKIVNYDLSDKISKIKIPVCLIWGDKDREIPYMGKYLANRLDNCQLRVIYGADHNPHLFQQAELSAIINHQLQS